MSIKVEGVSKVFNDKIKVLDNINIDIDEGDFVCLLGPSGCGKSTLLNMMAAFDKPTDGKIYINGIEVDKPTIERVTIFQNYGLLPWRNVEKNIEFGLETLKLPKVERKVVAEKYMRLVGLEKFKNHYPHQLSGGMQQRVAIARALAVKPKILFMDEPFGALDPIIRSNLQEEVRNIWREEGITIVFVTHDVEEAVYLGNKIIIMSPHPGRIREVINRENQQLIEKSSEEFYQLKSTIINILEENSRDGIEYYI
ncbi:ABC transporter [Clostridium bornimense]|uniref:ABC-type quaternary amine transporter n=1 Tax=Clostridium bornimense TaxID=1216932 RepID=W6RTF9_9CLOT|nr:ABC transporter ATP-binding protein [Clostridium bornimense]CDM67563.1 ABC transporter [Clostridium bornimense]